jgi:hypothetical protein
LQALVRLDNSSALIPNTVRWLMSARFDGHWLTTQETAVAVLALSDYMVAKGELSPSYSYRAALGDTVLRDAQVDANSVGDSFTREIPLNELQPETAFVLDKSEGPGSLFYSVYVKYYLPISGMQALSRGLIVQREYWNAENPGTAVSSGRLNEVITVKLTLIVPHDVYYVYLEDPIPAGTEIVDSSLRTSRQVLEPIYEDILEPEAEENMPDRWIWGWPWASHTEVRDNKLVLFASALTRGTYEYTYQVRCTTAGEFQVLPAAAYEMYQPDRFGRTAGQTFTVAE